MDKIAKAFSKGKANIGYIVAGYPSLEYTQEFLNALDRSALDMIEIGVPYSDPLADGKLIANAAFKACSAGVNTDRVFKMLSGVKSSKAMIFLVYYNVILAYGEDRFLKRAKECGISGILVPDMPFEESGELFGKCEEQGIAFIRLVAPTSAIRAREILAGARGFVYAVGSLGVTGGSQSPAKRLEEMIGVIKKNRNLPVAVGFGIKDAKDVKRTKEYADGAIVGTAIVEITGRYGVEEANEKIREIFA